MPAYAAGPSPQPSPQRGEGVSRSIDDIRAAQQAQIPAGRFGTPAEFGAICAFLCSQQAGYLTGQNILPDGGAYPGTY